jgi:hypothetical protein
MKLIAAIPTMDRPEIMVKNFKKMAENCTLPMDVVIVQDINDDNLALTKRDLLPMGCIENVKLRTFKGRRGVGHARYIGTQEALKMGADKILQTEDNVVMKPTSIERMCAPSDFDPRVGWCGPIGGYRQWDKEFTDQSVKFMVTPSVAFITTREVHEAIGNFERKIPCCEDQEFGVRCWVNGWRVIAIHAPIGHKRTGDTFVKGSDLWKKGKQFIQDKYGDKVTTTSNWTTRRNFDLPKETWELTDDLIYREVK